jgi:membrane-bound lytic murein transglycosylase B
VIGLLVSASAHAQSGQPIEPAQPGESIKSAFDSWLADLRQEAAAQGISRPRWMRRSAISSSPNA